MLVSNALIVFANSFHAQETILFTKPSALELIVRNDEEEDDAHAHGKLFRVSKLNP